MRNTGVYLLEVELGALRYKNLPPGNILFTLRIGIVLTIQEKAQHQYASVLSSKINFLEFCS